MLASLSPDLWWVRRARSAALEDLDENAQKRRTELSADRRTIACDPTGRPRAFIEPATEMIEDPIAVTTLTGPRSAAYDVERTVHSGGRLGLIERDLAA